MHDKNVRTIAIALTAIVFIITFEFGSYHQQRLANQLYNADQAKLLECAQTNGAEYCYLLINGNCE